MKSRCLRTILVGAILVLAACACAEDQSKNADWSNQKPEMIGQVLTDTSPGKLKERVEPEYPDLAKTRGIQGTVVLSVQTDKKGKVTSVSVTSGDPLLADAAATAVSKWRFVPFKSESVPSGRQVTVTFVLRKMEWECKGNQAKLVDSSPATDQNTAGSAQKEAEAIRNVGNGVTAPKPTYMPDPELPDRFRGRKGQGTVRLGAIVSSDGKVRMLRLLKKVGYGFDEIAAETVCRWKFTPAIENGKPVPARITVEVAFQIY